MIEFRDVSKRYPDGTAAVDSFSLVVPSHETVVFVGSSGSGKTTLLRMVNRMIDPTSGTVLIDDRDDHRVRHHPGRAPAKQVYRDRGTGGGKRGV